MDDLHEGVLSEFAERARFSDQFWEKGTIEAESVYVVGEDKHDQRSGFNNQNGIQNKARRKLTDDQVREIRKRKKPVKGLAREFGVSPPVIRDVIKFRSYADVR